MFYESILYFGRDNVVSRYCFSIPYNIIAPKIGTFYFYCCHCLSYYFFCYLIMYSENFHLNYDITQNSAVQKKTITKNLLDAQKKSRWPVKQSTLQKENHKNVPCHLCYSTLVRVTGLEPARFCH